MEQFRIVEVRKGTKIHYEIQKLDSFFIFWYWRTLTKFSGCVGGLYSTCFEGAPLQFEYIEKAEKYLKENYPGGRNVVKYINL
jgi:hypothetical protein